MNGVTDFRKMQLGRERVHSGDAGTAVAATALWRGIGVGIVDTQPIFPEENLGYLLDTTREYTPMVAASIKKGPDPLDFEQFPYTLAAAIRGIEHGVRDGAGSGYIYHYDWPLTADQIQKTATTVAFVSATKKITDSGNGLAFVKTGDIIQVSGSTSNNGIYLVATGGVAGEIVTTEALVDEAAGDSVTIEVLTQVYTVEGGNNKQVLRSAYTFPTAFDLSGKGGSDMDAIKLSSSWQTRVWGAFAAFTAGINPPAVSEAFFGRTKLFIDAINGTMGTTEKPRTLAGFSYKVNTNMKRQFSGSGELYFSWMERAGKPGISCDLQLYHNDAALAEYDAWEDHTPRLLRLLIEGPALASAGTTYSKKSIILNMPGSWVKFPNLDSLAGVDIFPCTFRPAYDPTAGIGPSITVVNELAALP